MYLSRKRSLAFTTALMLVLSMFAMFPKGAFAAGAVDEYDLEIGGPDGESHAEHDYHEEIVDPLGLYPQAGIGDGEGQHGCR